MSTYDTPGHNPKNADRLAMGSWAEHPDGSLVFVASVEGGRVVYCIFAPSAVPHPLEYRNAMPEDEFKRQFSWPNSTGIRWEWHDKRPFPWERVMAAFPAGSKIPSADQQISAAQRVAAHLGLQARKLTLRNIPTTARRMMDKIAQTLLDLGS